MSRFEFGRSRPAPEPERAAPKEPEQERAAPKEPEQERAAPEPEPERAAPREPEVRQRPLEPEQERELRRAQARLEREERTRMLKAAGVFRESYNRSDTRPHVPTTLSERDVVVMNWLKANTVAPVDVLAAQFFAKNPKNGRTNSNPERAAIRRLDELARAGYLVVATVAPSASRENGGRVYALGRAGSEAMGVPLQSVAPKRMHHHLQTLRHVEVIRKELENEGRRITSVEHERGEMATRERNAGRHVPDAIITVDDGSTIAVEYVSTDYTDEMVRSKGAYFTERYGQVRWSANSEATRARVQRVTGEGKGKGGEQGEGAACEIIMT
jgi:hypothetical protein